MKFLFTMLLVLFSYSFSFDYERMLERRGYSNQGEGYYFKYVEGFEHTSYHFYNSFRYSECFQFADSLLCQTTFVDCNEYLYWHTIDHEAYFRGVLIDGYEFSYEGRRVIEADSYEDKVCVENKQHETE